MASIPNLNTLRTGRRGTRLRVRRDGRAPGSGAADSQHTEQDLEAGRDEIIQHTDNDASSSRMSAVSLGYLDDKYAAVFFPAGQPIAKRYPIINRGTYVRTKAIDLLVNRFLQSSPEIRKQIISLGAGSDTRFFRLCAGQHQVTYIELDFEANVVPKRTAIRSSPELARMTLPKEDGASYYLHAIDLRDLTNKSPPFLPGMDPELPTLILSECCLCYMPPDTATSVIQYFSMNIKSDLAMILYEPIRPFDAFGKTMVTNLASRGIHLQTLKRYSSLQAQRHRLRLAGFSDGQGGRDVHRIWSTDAWVTGTERERIERLEWLDEVEEWHLLASHYCVAWGWKGNLFSHAWKDIEGGATNDEDEGDMMRP